MARPKKDQDLPSGRQRIQDAFWKLYQERPFERVTVKDVCELASVNKTTFYYHYDSTEELLAQIEDECMPTEMPDAVIEGIKAGEGIIRTYASFIEDSERLDRICLLLSSKGDPSFSRRMKDVMKDLWCHALGLDYELLTAHNKLLMELIMGGTTSLLAAMGDGMDVDLDEFIGIVDEVLTPVFSHVLDGELLASA